MKRVLLPSTLFALGIIVGIASTTFFKKPETPRGVTQDIEKTNTPDTFSEPNELPDPSIPETSSAESFTSRYHSLLAEANTPKKVESLSQLFLEWGAAEGEAAFQFAKTLEGRDHLAYLTAAAAGWSKRDAAAAWDAMLTSTNHGAMLTGQLRSVLTEIAKTDISTATGLLLKIKTPATQFKLLESVLDQADTAAIRSNVLAEILDSDASNKDLLVQSFFRNWGRYDTEQPLSELSGLSDPALSRQAMIGMLEGWASVDGQGAFDYLIESDDTELVNNALPSVAKQWAQTSTADEMESLVDTVSQLENSDSVLKNLIPTIAFANPELALASAQSFDEETARNNHTRDALTIWANSDLSAAEDYFMSMPQTKAKDYAIWGLFSPAIHQNVDPAHIVGYVSSFEDPQSQMKSLYSMAEYTRVVDMGDTTQELEQAIRDYLSNSELTQEHKEKVLGQLATPEG